jgi:predicted nucleic acid-binding protein
MILDETRRTLRKIGYPNEKVDRRIRAMSEAFEDALVSGFECLIPAMTNDAKDRHVLAAAILCKANAIVTDNKRHFEAVHVAQYGIEVMSADEFLVHQLHLNKDEVTLKLERQARAINRTLADLVQLSRNAPQFANAVNE